MGYHAETKIQREEAYVNKHAASIDRTIHSKEFKLGTLSYVETGHVPHDKFWMALAKQEAKDPAKFFAHNPQYVGFFTAPAKLGELPHNNVIFDVMKDRDEHQPAVFSAHHPFYAVLVNRDLQLESASSASTSTPATTTSTTSTTVPPFSTTTASDPGTAIVAGSPLGSSSDLQTSTSSPSPSGITSAAGAVPEPASIVLVALGLVAALGLRVAFASLRKRRAVLA